VAELKIYAKPSKLFRYRPLGKHTERELEAIREGYIYCPRFNSMNDPMEGIYRFSESLANSSGSETNRAKLDAALEKMGIASMSEVFDHEPMWAHYAGSFSGMCVQYSLSKLITGLERDIAITRMMYSETAPVLLNQRSIPMDRACMCLSSETVRWSSEREWRLFKEEHGAASYKDLTAVTKIFLGSRISADDEDLVRKLANQLKIRVAKMHVNAYSLEFEPVRRIKRN
jgi:hypothetical protein